MNAAPLLIFSHANGYPAGTYRRLFDIWRAAGWRVAAVEKYGHDPRYPVSSNWPHLRDQLLAFIDEQAPAGTPLVLVGHSMGGFLSLMAASRRRKQVEAVVVLDSPVIGGWRAHSLQVLKATRLLQRMSPGRISEKRRHQWPDLESVRTHYQSKHVFSRWDPGVLEDYLHAGIEPDHGTGGVRLAFDRAVETRVYDTLPHQLGRLLRRHPLACPAGFIGGTQSQEIRMVGLAATRALVRERLRWLEGSHLFPMEHPEATAHEVLALLAEAGAPTATLEPRPAA
jgi:pimeloyl-ACP methyl ester carboxylesterase